MAGRRAQSHKVCRSCAMTNDCLSRAQVMGRLQARQEMRGVAAHINHAYWTRFQRVSGWVWRQWDDAQVQQEEPRREGGRKVEEDGWVATRSGGGLHWSTKAATSPTHTTRGVERVGWGARHDGGLGWVARGPADASPPAAAH